jgi:hypothetical protein
VPNSRHRATIKRRTAIIILSVLAVLIGSIAYTIVSLDALVAGIVENRLNRDTPGRFEVEIDRLRLHPEGGIAVDTIVFLGAAPTQRFHSVTVTEVRIDADVATILRQDASLTLTVFEVASVTVRLRPQEDRPEDSDPPDAAPTAEPPSLGSRIGRVENTVAQAIGIVATVPAFETKVLLTRGPSNTLAEGAFSLKDTAATFTGSYQDYAFQLVFSDAPREIEGTIRRPGTEIRATATRGSASGTVVIDSLGGGSRDGGPLNRSVPGKNSTGGYFANQATLPFGLDHYISRIGSGTGTVSISFDEAAKSQDSSSVLQPLVQPLEQLVADARIAGNLQISDASVRYQGTDLPPELNITAGSFSVSEENGVFHGSGEVRVQNGASIELTDVSVPIDAPWETSFAVATLAVPLNTPIPATILPEGVVSGVLPLVASQTEIIGHDGNVSLPEVTIELSKPTSDSSTDGGNASIIDVTARIERPGRVRLITDASVDLEARRIVDSTTDFSWRSVPVDTPLWWEITGGLTLSTPFDAFRSLATNSLPASVAGEFDLYGTNTETEVTVEGRIDSGTVHVSRGAAVYKDKRYLLESDTAISAEDGRFILSPTRVAIGSGHVVVEGGVTAEAVTGSLAVDRVPVSWFLSDESRYRDTSGFVSGNVSFRRSGTARLEASASLQGEELTILGSDGSGSIEVRHDARGFEIVSGTLAIESLIEGTIDGRLPIAIGTDGLELLNLAESTFHATLRSAEFERFFPPSDQGLVPAGRLEIDAHLEEQTGDLRSTIRFLVRTEDADEMFGVGTASTGFGYERLTSTLRLRERDGDRLTIGVDLSADNESIATVSAMMTVPGLSTARPKLDPKGVDWQISGTSALPLEYVAPFVPGVIAMTGELDGTIDVGGTVASPTVDGSVSIRDGELRLSEPIPPISALSGTIRFDGETYATETFSGETGLAPFTVDLSGRFPSDDLPGSMRVRVIGDNVLLASTPAVRLRAATNVEIVGSNKEGYTVGGTIAVTEGIYSQDIPLIDFDSVPRIDTEMLQLFSVNSPFGEKTELALDIRSNAAFRVENNIYEGPLSADLTLGGTLSIPQPEGRVFTDRGTLQLPLTTISVRQGSLQFPSDSPFSPVVRAQGSAQIRDYRVTAIVSGQLPGIEINLSSTPPLSQSDALVLLTTGLTPRELSESGNRSALAIGSRLGTQFVRSLVGTAGSEVGTDIADRVSVILGEGVSESGDETIEIEFRLTDEDSWFLVFRRDRFERYNLDLSWRFWLE